MTEKESKNRFYSDKLVSTFRKLMADEPGHAEPAAILQLAKMTHPPFVPLLVFAVFAARLSNAFGATIVFSQTCTVI